MKVLYFAILFSFAISAIYTQSSETTWQDPASGTKYDFTALKRDAG